jgi:membrane-associated protease RseP (regulator of RpoE activity)
MIVEVAPDGPADRAGLSEGDLVVLVDGQEIDEDNDLASVIAERKPGDEITVEVTQFGPRFDREGRKVTVTLAEHPETAGKAYLGVTFVPMSGDEFGDGGRMHWFHEYGDDDPCDDCEDHDGRFERHFEFRWPRR